MNSRLRLGYLRPRIARPRFHRPRAPRLPPLSRRIPTVSLRCPRSKGALRICRLPPQLTRRRTCRFRTHLLGRLCSFRHRVACRRYPRSMRRSWLTWSPRHRCPRGLPRPRSLRRNRSRPRHHLRTRHLPSTPLRLPQHRMGRHVSAGLPWTANLLKQLRALRPLQQRRHRSPPLVHPPRRCAQPRWGPASRRRFHRREARQRRPRKSDRSCQGARVFRGALDRGPHREVPRATRFPRDSPASRGLPHLGLPDRGAWRCPSRSSRHCTAPWANLPRTSQCTKETTLRR